MMNRLFRTLGILVLAGALLFGLQGGNASADGCGTCGEDLVWNADDDGVLTVSGTGEMYSYIEATPGWSSLQLTKVIIEPGVTSVGALAFERQTALEEAEIADTVTRIGDYAFAECTGLRIITVPAGVTEIGRDIFADMDPVGLIVCTPEDSAMEAYCSENRLRTVLPGQHPDESTIRMPRAFTDAYPGYTGLYRMAAGENEAVFLARTPDGVQVLLCGTEREETGWSIIESASLPAESRVVMHDGVEMLDTGNARCTVRRYYDDVWGIECVDWRSIAIGPKWIGSYASLVRDFGIHPWGDLTVIDWISLDNDWDRLIRQLDLSSYAVPDRPDRKERTPLWILPDESGGKFADLINGVPLFVTEKRGEWTHVCLGRDDGTAWKLEGWVRTEDLAFGKEAGKVILGEPGYLFCVSETVDWITPQGAEQFSGKEYDTDTYMAIGERTFGTAEYWLMYDCYTEKIGLIPKEQLRAPNG